MEYILSLLRFREKNTSEVIYGKTCAEDDIEKKVDYSENEDDKSVYITPISSCSLTFFPDPSLIENKEAASFESSKPVKSSLNPQHVQNLFSSSIIRSPLQSLPNPSFSSNINLTHRQELHNKVIRKKKNPTKTTHVPLKEPISEQRIPTPEGLKPRRTISDLRKKLRLPATQPRHYLPKQQNAETTEINQTTNKPCNITHHSKNKLSNGSQNNEIPFPQVVLSPQFAGDGAKTAVGALIAQTNCVKNQLQLSQTIGKEEPVSSTIGLSFRKNEKNKISFMRETVQLGRSNSHFTFGDDENHGVTSADIVRNDQCRLSEFSEFSYNDQTKPLSYHSNAFSSLHSSQSSSPTLKNEVCGTSSSMSLAWKQYEEYRDEQEQDVHNDNNLCRDEIKGMEVKNTHCAYFDKPKHHSYDFTSLVENNDAIPVRSMIYNGNNRKTNDKTLNSLVIRASENTSLMSDISQYTDFNSPVSIQKYCNAAIPEREYDSRKKHCNERGITSWDEELQNRKDQNQNQLKEKYIIGIIHRLRDNQNLVTEVESLHDEQDSLTQEMSTILDNFPKTSMSKPGVLFSGYTKEEIQKIVLKLEQFNNGNNNSDGDLQHALHFVIYVLKEKKLEHSWEPRPWLRTAIGLDHKAPCRWGDTGLHSQIGPDIASISDCNSMVSTIASPLSSSSAYKPADISVNNLMFKTIELITAVLQKITIALERCFSSEIIQATEEIKRHYLQLMNISVRNLSGLNDAFAPVDHIYPVVAISTNSLEEIPENLFQLPKQNNGMCRNIKQSFG